MDNQAAKLSPSSFHDHISLLLAGSTNDRIEDMEESRKGAKKNRQRSSSSTAGFFHDPCQNCSSPSDHFCQSSGFTHATSSKVTTVEQPLKHGCDCNYIQPSSAPSVSKDAAVSPGGVDKIKTSHNSQRSGLGVAWQWSRMRQSIIRKNDAMGFQSTRHFKGYPRESPSEANCSQSQALSQENSREEIDPINQENLSDSAFKYAYFSRNDSQHTDREQKRLSVSEHRSSTSLSHKYQPKSFQQVVGHEINIKVIFNAVQRNKVAQLYLFHGPSGTGKTSTARIFAMALHCESTSLDKPCWTCRGCCRSLYMMDLCSGSRTTGFLRISTLLQCTSFAQAVPGFKVFIIEESHSLTAEAWDELLGILENTYSATLIFVLIAEDANMIPECISSKCQKFCFPRLNNMDVTLKLARIVAEEAITIEKDAVKLIVAKAEGSLKEAEHILDQLTLLGPRITSSMVQQLVGLVPQNKLINLLKAALSGDTKKTIITARELVATGVEAEAIIFQLTSLITDILTGVAINIPTHSAFAGPSKDEELLETESQFIDTQSDNLCYALKILLDAEKQPRSSFDNITWVYAALLQIASRDISDGISSGISFPKRTLKPLGDTIQSHSRNVASYHSTSNTYVQQNRCSRDLNITNASMEKTVKYKGKGVARELNLASMRDMDEIWLNILERIESRDIKQFLSSHVKLASLTVSSANVIVHLMFKRAEAKLAAQMSEQSISKALETAIGCLVMVNMSLEPVELGIIKEDTASTNNFQSAECNHPREPHQKSFPEILYKANSGATLHQSTYRKLGSSSVSNPQLTELKDSTLIAEVQAARETEARSQILPFSGSLMQENQMRASTGPTTNSLGKDQLLLDVAQILRKEEPKHSWLSLSSFQQNDASVEPYSQDILFEIANVDKENRAKKGPKLPKGSSKVHEVNHLHENRESIGLFRSWSCKEVLCQKKTKRNNRPSARLLKNNNV
ncbi:protein STICHEL-like isoform X2 [Hevea brasiliensis]|uniref:protein STICHEL-like isoform X2 n=1 Tax=Hevea brasiliensis TaxID=3981 RepID=UPI0025FCA408|nr:protein STICHEL-like isoform X2 [Hevea brasiliensis]